MLNERHGEGHRDYISMLGFFIVSDLHGDEVNWRFHPELSMVR